MSRRMQAVPATVFAVLASIAVTGGRSAADVPHPTLRGIRPLGMGDAFVAVAEDRNALYYNPAGLSNVTRTRISGFGIHGAIDNEFFEVVNFIQEHEDEFSDLASIDAAFFDELAPYDDRWVGADAGAYLDFTRPGMGLGVYSAGRAQVKVDRGVYEPRVEANVLDDIVAVAGGSMHLGRGDVSVGGALKVIWRRQFARALTARELVDFQAADLADRLTGADSGFSMDLGALWQPKGSRFSGGAVLRDAAGTVAGESVGAAFDLGGAWRPSRRVVVAADLRDLFDGNSAFGTKIRLGAEARVAVVAFRAGIHQGYPALGASLGSTLLAVDYAFYGRELGELPGAESQYLHAVEARLGF